MVFIRCFRSLILAICAVGVLTGSADAQQRIQISDLIQRIDRLETEVVRLRVSQGGGGGADSARLDLIEQELRRLTGFIERLDFDTRRAAAERDKRLDDMEARLEAFEGGGGVAAAPTQSFNSDTSFSVAAPPPLGSPNETVVSEFVQPPEAQAYQPEVTFSGQPEPVIQQSFEQPTFQTQPAPQSFQNADILYDEGVRLLNLGSFDQAGAQFEDLIAAHPDDPKAGQAQFWLGDMHFKLGRFEQAATAFLDSFRKWPAGPKAPDSLLKLGMTLANIGKTEEACLSFRQVAARYPGAPPTLLRRADIESQRYRCGG